MNKVQSTDDISDSALTNIHQELTYGVQLTCASSIQPEAINWIWCGYIALGKLHILAGVPATGKTSIALAFAAVISLGGSWPDQTKCEEGNVLIWSGEDDPKDTLVPRLMALGAKIDNIHFISGVLDKDAKSRPFDPSADFPELHEAAKKIGNIKLIIVDPIVNAVSGDSHQNGNVRRCLQPLVELAVSLNTAVLGITHFTKGTVGRDPLERVTGSLAFGALARVVLVTTQDTTSIEVPRYLLSRVKSNIGKDGDGFYYNIKESKLPNNPGIITSIVKWREQAKGRAKELLGGNSISEDKISALDEAKDFLVSLLSDGSMLQDDIHSMAKNMELSKRTLYRAKKELGIVSVKSGFGIGSTWAWNLVPKVVEEYEDCHTKLLATFGQDGDLLEQLMHKHPAVVEGCLLVDILSHVESGDMNTMIELEGVKCFAQYLISSGKLRPNICG